VILSVAPAVSGEEQVAMVVKRPFLLALIFGVPVALALHPDIYNPDFWWHIRTGDWILQHHSVPQFDPFTQSGAQRTFIAYSWLFEVVSAKLFARVGLPFLPAATAILTAAIFLALFSLLRSFRTELTHVALLLVCAAWSMHAFLYLRTWLFSLFFFVFVLWILFRPNSPKKWSFIFIPLLFVIWVNIHVQFTYGLFALGLFFAEGLLVRFTKWQLQPTLPQWTVKDRAVLLTLSTLATLVNPYGYRVYEVVYIYATQTKILPMVRETSPLTFHGPLSLLLLIVPVSAVWFLTHYRERRPFVLALFAWVLFAAFHMARDWMFLTVVTAFVIAATTADQARDETRIPVGSAFAAAVIVMVVALGLWRIRRINEHHLEAILRQELPAGGADFIERNHLTGPLFNSWGWGGYLIWRLPSLPVSIDGRLNVNGQDRMIRNHQTVNAAPDWANDPELKVARLILIPSGAPLASVFKIHPCFLLAYSDSVSALFTPRDDCWRVQSNAKPGMQD
jgi:hypothetical protein